MSKKWILIGTSIVVILIGTFMVVKKVSPVSWGLWGSYNTSAGIAMNGYDPVAYFTTDQATRGNERFAYEWRGAIWHFSSAENRAAFSANPESYAPQFGGFCSFAVSKGFTADVSPDAWHIDDGKLYIFADQDVQKNWVESMGEGSLESSKSKWAKR